MHDTSLTSDTTRAERNPAPAIVGALAAVALILLAIVDFRRGFLLEKADYAFVSPFCFFSPWQLLLLGGGIGLLWTMLKTLRHSSESPRAGAWLLGGLFGLLLADLLLYRGVAASRALEKGKVGLDWLKAFGVDGWQEPVALTGSYLLTVWHATFLSCLMAGLALVAMPRYLQALQRQQGWRATLAGGLMALTQPFCSCCAAMMSPAVLGSGRSMRFGVAVLLGAPLLNLSTLFLAAQLLPGPYAALRIGAGILLTLGLSALMARMLGEECLVSDRKARSLDIAFNLPGDIDHPADLLSAWLRLSGRVAVILIPSMILGTLVAAVLWGFWPKDLSDGPVAVLLASVLGTLLMVSTWSEIPLALQMLDQGLNGPAAAVLVALPAVNLASLWLMARTTGQWKLAVGLGGAVMVSAVGVGLLFG